MDADETHAEYKSTPCFGHSHAWEIVMDYNDEEESLTLYGTECAAVEEMIRLFDDTFDGGTTSEGYPPEVPAIYAHCEKHDITLTLELMRNKY